MKPCSFCFVLIFYFLCLLYRPLNSQQSYEPDIYDSHGNSSMSKGYLCNDSHNWSCQSYVTFRSQPPYDSAISIGTLLGSDSAGIAFVNNLSPDNRIPSGNLVIVGFTCSCYNGLFEHNVDYFMANNETLSSIVNNTFQGLTTFKALTNFEDPDLVLGSALKVPLRCACPSLNQTEGQVLSLLTYMVAPEDTITSIANDFQVDEKSILEANMLSQDSVIYPSTPLLIPLKVRSCIISPKICNAGEKFPVKLVILLGIGIGFVFLCTCLSGYMLHRFLKNRRYRMQKEKLFKQNGGFLLQQRLSSVGSKERAKIFTAEELQSATDNYNQSRFLGQGGFGVVYKGMLPDGNIVAVKRSKKIDKTQVEQFVNEVVILSQINHRNIVKLLGCCLETELPVLVYEFIPNGTLSHLIHDHQKEQESSLSWEHRLRIACEVAGAVAYIHSAASIPIFHRDIKSSNILLDDKYNAKVSDFGTSRSIPNDKTHLSTVVQGTFGYLDPEYFQSSRFTEKSDVYSFGVVLVELLTGKKPVSFAREAEGRNLVADFISLAKENQLLEILDTRVAKEAKEEDLQAIAKLAVRCLKLNGKKRPIMKQVAMELEGLIRSQSCLEICQEPQQVRDEMLYIETGEETEEGSTEDSLGFPLQLESESF